MSDSPHVLAQQLLGRSTIEACSVQEVKALAQQYPYFAPAQFLLLQKLKQEGNEDYPAQLQKAILFYPDPVAFQAFIDAERFHTELPQPLLQQTFREEVKEVTIEEEAVAAPVVVQEEVDTTAATESPSAFTQDTVEETSAPIIAEEIPVMETSIDGESPAVSGPAEPVADIPTPGAATAPTSGFTFEPYHTVDYFASQGIKLSQEEIPKDKFGKQLKSFTEWLKTMKRLPATEAGGPLDAGSESKVQGLAKVSIHDSSVWTEAMAEVWIKQGNKAKAIEVYNKLSLLNPSKKAYFAGKIENLKRS